LSTADHLDDSTAYLAVGEGPDAWTAATAEQHGTQKLLDVETLDPNERVAAALELAADEHVVVRRRLMLLDGKPVEIANSYYPVLLAHGTPLAEKAKIRGGAPRAIAELGLQVVEADEEVELDSVPTFAEAALLEVAEDVRVVRLFRTAYTNTGTPVEVTESVMLPAGRVLRHRISVG